MEQNHYNKEFSDINYSEQQLRGKVFEQCSFLNCDFSYSDLSDAEFIDCTFNRCGFIMTIVKHTGLKNVSFVNSKLAGVDFGQCATFCFGINGTSSEFRSCSFYKQRMRKTSFNDCLVKECYFSDCDLTESSFVNSNLDSSQFEKCILDKVNFSTSNGYLIDPELNRMKKTKFSKYGLEGLLFKYDLIIEE
ncbi:MAG: pentapeptide repeat-containing protein [Bacteroidota bacterium]|nr:pentapeptide repeat-containing protein [Bacteroidota bacterium]